MNDDAKKTAADLIAEQNRQEDAAQGFLKGLAPAERYVWTIGGVQGRFVAWLEIVVKGGGDEVPAAFVEGDLEAGVCVGGLF